MHNSTDLTDIELDKMWKSIDWKQAERAVSNLQARIARAALEEKWKDVNRLTRLLTRSYFAKLIAVRQVTSSKGRKTPGMDGLVWKTPAEKMQGAIRLNGRGYRAMPLLRKYIPKKNGKLRPLSIPTIKDRAMQALYALALDPIEYATGDRSSFGFRKSRSTKDACHQIFNCVSKRYSAQWILEADIRACFDMISHEWLAVHIPMKTSILKQFLKSGFLENARLFPTLSGTPQGGVISPILANMVLNGFERILGERFYATKKGIIDKANCNKHKVNLIRYADDIVVTADSKETAEEIKQMLTSFPMKINIKLVDSNQ
jgi:RNA-directed DNA polymerase